MAIERPGAIDAASLATAAQRRMARERLSCFARNGGVAGRRRKSIGAIAAWAIEAQPAFGQIKPLKRPFRAVAPTDLKSRRMWRLSSSLKESSNAV
jgi:hypothetical protein